MMCWRGGVSSDGGGGSEVRRPAALCSGVIPSGQRRSLNSLPCEEQRGGAGGGGVLGEED